MVNLADFDLQFSVFFECKHIEYKEDRNKHKQHTKIFPDFFDTEALYENFLKAGAPVIDRHEIGKISKAVWQCINRNQPAKKHLRNYNQRNELHYLKLVVGKNRDECTDRNRSKSQKHHNKYGEPDRSFKLHPEDISAVQYH